MAAPAPFSMKASAIVAEDKLAEFLGGAVEDELTTVPGIGPSNKALLIEAGIKTVHVSRVLTLNACWLSQPTETKTQVSKVDSISFRFLNPLVRSNSLENSYHCASRASAASTTFSRLIPG